VIKEAYDQSVEMDKQDKTRKMIQFSDFADENEGVAESVGAPPREVGHNLYILAHKLAKFNKDLSLALRSVDNIDNNKALAYYAAHTAQIEIIREDRAMEQIVFPVPTVCEYLTKETKQKIFLTTEKDEQNSKITGFFDSVPIMWKEMKWQKKLRQQSWLYWFSSHMSLWSDVTFNFSVLINLLVAIFYPFSTGIRGICTICQSNYICLFLKCNAVQFDHTHIKKMYYIFIINTALLITSIA
jgi:inositol 1,4,5-triphosphate receptor type 1